MATNKLSDGVGKKIVEALKKQSEIEINPIPQEEVSETSDAMTDDISTLFDEPSESNILEEMAEESIEPTEAIFEQHQDDIAENNFAEALNEDFSMQSAPAFNYQKPATAIHDTFINELDNFEIPSNIAVLKKLITQLPNGVSRHTGAQIIKQTMEALGISMKSVLQEAQQVQDGLSLSAKECHTSIQEYKNQIKNLEKQALNYQKQYTAINELISLFVQTGL